MPVDPFEESKGAFEEAMNIFDEAFGEETDEELKFYDSLDPSDLRAMAKEHGLTGTLEFIKRMEHKRITGGK